VIARAPGMAPAVRATVVGTTAYDALARDGGTARVLARLTASTWLTAGGEIVWLGPPDAPRHARAILARDLAIAGDEVRVDARGLVPWRPRPLTLDARGAGMLVDGGRRLAAALGPRATPGGFGGWLTGAPLAFPLAGAGAAARALAAACARDDASAAGAAARALLGVGGGLTPSGDDFVGGALFARRLLTDAGAVDPLAWRRVADAVLAAAPALTHPISVALLGDLAAGLGWAPLHDLAAALADGAAAAALTSAERLVGLGHSSGWDVLAGLAAGLGAIPA
jgi:hypothetical protein